MSNDAPPAHTQPVLFLPHGAPTFALQPGAAGAAISKLADSLHRPRAVLVISAHWCTDEVTVGITDTPETIHDFHGFPSALYDIHYPTLGDRAIGIDVAEHLRQAGFVTTTDSQRGLDHGAWIPLRQLFPQANVPVITLSLQPHRGTEHHLRLGAALAALPREGILVLASGNLTHNLADYRSTSDTAEALDYVRRFADWVWMQLQRRSSEALLRYRNLAPDAVRAHPSEEHLLPLFVAIGAAGNDWQIERLYSGIDGHALAMDSFVFRPSIRGEAA